ncbi:MAG: integrase core domain-containing protein, partial [Bacteroidota bacterium]|nr:integrase core domain-containing protein [Bacteroidota bacterium]
LMKLSFRRKGKKRLPASIKTPLTPMEGLNKGWSIDFMSDALVDGRRIRVLDIIDEYSREALTVYPDYSMPSSSVINQMRILEKQRGLPSRIRVDNGPEFTSFEFTEWCSSTNIEITFIQPGRPMQNAFIERFNKTYRGDILDAYLFENLEEVRILTDEWMFSYNNEIPHGSLHDLTPVEYARAINSGKPATLKTQAGFTTINSNNRSSNSRKKSKLALSVLKSRRLHVQ